MPTHDQVFGDIAILLRSATPAAIEDGHAEARRSPGVSLSEVLVRRGVLTSDARERLLILLESCFSALAQSPEDASRDVKLASLLIDQGLIDPSFIRTAFQRLRQMSGTDAAATLGQILIDGNLLTEPQLGEHLVAVDASRFHCASCGALFHVPRCGGDGRYICPRCDSRAFKIDGGFVFPDEADSVHDSSLQAPAPSPPTSVGIPSAPEGAPPPAAPLPQQPPAAPLPQQPPAAPLPHASQTPADTTASAPEVPVEEVDRFPEIAETVIDHAGLPPSDLTESSGDTPVVPVEGVLDSTAGVEAQPVSAGADPFGISDSSIPTGRANWETGDADAFGNQGDDDVALAPEDDRTEADTDSQAFVPADAGAIEAARQAASQAYAAAPGQGADKSAVESELQYDEEAFSAPGNAEADINAMIDELAAQVGNEDDGGAGDSAPPTAPSAEPVAPGELDDLMGAAVGPGSDDLMAAVEAVSALAPLTAEGAAAPTAPASDVPSAPLLVGAPTAPSVPTVPSDPATPSAPGGPTPEPDSDDPFAAIEAALGGPSSEAHAFDFDAEFSDMKPQDPGHQPAPQLGSYQIILPGDESKPEPAIDTPQNGFGVDSAIPGTGRKQLPSFGSPTGSPPQPATADVAAGSDGADPFAGESSEQADPFAGASPEQADSFAGASSEQADPFAGASSEQADPFAGASSEQADPFADAAAAQDDPFGGAAGESESFASTAGEPGAADPFGSAAGQPAGDPFASAAGGTGADPFASAVAPPGAGDPFGGAQAGAADPFAGAAPMDEMQFDSSGFAQPPAVGAAGAPPAPGADFAGGEDLFKSMPGETELGITSTNAGLVPTDTGSGEPPPAAVPAAPSRTDDAFQLDLPQVRSADELPRARSSGAIPTVTEKALTEVEAASVAEEQARDDEAIREERRERTYRAIRSGTELFGGDELVPDYAGVEEGPQQLADDDAAGELDVASILKEIDNATKRRTKTKAPTGRRSRDEISKIVVAPTVDVPDIDLDSVDGSAAPFGTPPSSQTDLPAARKATVAAGRGKTTVQGRGRPKTVPPIGRKKTVSPTGRPATVPPRGRPKSVPPTRRPKTVPPTGRPKTVPPADAGIAAMASAATIPDVTPATILHGGPDVSDNEAAAALAAAARAVVDDEGADGPVEGFFVPPGPESGEQPMSPDEAAALFASEEQQEAIEAAGGRTHIGPYEVLKLLGRGGMGIVFLARHTKLDRQVALKTLIGDVATNPALLKRFEKEARAVAHLRHPGITGLYEMGQDADTGAWYLAMEFVDGVALDVWVQRVKPAVQQKLAVMIQLADALAEAHDRGVLHRDIKPANVLITAGGQAKLTDFGLAKDLDAGDEEAAKLTRTGQVMGTPGFMSPEQARGEIDQLDARSDQFSLGTLGYELLTGVNPFTEGAASIIQALARVCRHEPALIRSRTQDVSPALESIIFKMLEKERDNRYPSLYEVLEDLRRCRKGERVVARRQTVALRFGKWIGRHKIAVSLTAATVLLAATAGILYYFFVVQAEELERERIRTAQLEAEQLKADRAVAVSDLSEAHARGDASGVDDAVETLLGHEEEWTSEERFLLGWYYASDAGGEDPDRARTLLAAAANEDETLAEAYSIIATLALAAGDEDAALDALDQAAEAALARDPLNAAATQPADTRDPALDQRRLEGLLRQFPMRERRGTEAAELVSASDGGDTAAVEAATKAWRALRERAVEAVRRAPRHALSLAYLGLAEGMLGAAAAADEALIASMTEDPNSALAHAFAARVALLAGRHEEALQENTRALELDPALPGLFALRESAELIRRAERLAELRQEIAEAGSPAGQVDPVVDAVALMMEDEQWTAARAQLDTLAAALTADGLPLPAAVLAVRAALDDAVGEERQALRGYADAVAADDADARVFRDAGAFALRTGDHDRAGQWLGESLRRAPGDVATVHALARLDLARGRVEAAAARIENNAASRDWPPALLTLGRLARRLGRPTEAAQHWRAVLAAPFLAPDVAQGITATAQIETRLAAAIELFELYLSRNAPVLASEVLAPQFTLHPAPLRVYLARAVEYERVGRVEDAAADIAHALELAQGDDRRVLEAYADWLARQGAYDDAIDLHRRLYEQHPFDRRTLLAALDLALRIGQVATAESLMVRAREVLPASSLALAEAEVLLAFKRGDELSGLRGHIAVLETIDPEHPSLPIWQRALAAPAETSTHWLLAAPPEDDAVSADGLGPALIEAERRLDEADPVGALAVIAPWNTIERRYLDGSAMAARARSAAGDSTGAAATFDRVRSDRRMRASDWEDVLVYARAAGDLELAEEARVTLGPLKPNSFVMLEQRARIAMRQGDLIGAATRWRRLIETVEQVGIGAARERELRRITRTWALLSARAGDGARVIEACEAGLKHAPNDTELNLFAALYADHAGDADGGVARRAMRLELAALTPLSRAGAIAAVLLAVDAAAVADDAAVESLLADADLALARSPLPPMLDSATAVLGFYLDYRLDRLPAMIEATGAYGRNWPKLRWLRSLALFRSDRFDEARLSARQLTDRDLDGLPYARLLHALVLAELGDLDVALRSVLSLLIAPEEGDALGIPATRVTCGQLLFQAERFSEARDQFRLVLDTPGQRDDVTGLDRVAQMGVVLCSLALGEPQTAEAAFEALVSEGAVSTSFVLDAIATGRNTALSLGRSGRASELLALAERFVDELPPESPRRWLALGALAADAALTPGVTPERRRESLAEAATYFDRAAPLAPRSAEPWAYRARVALERDDLDAVTAACDKGLALDPTLSDLYLIRATANRRSGNTRLALDDLREARDRRHAIGPLASEAIAVALDAPPAVAVRALELFLDRAKGEIDLLLLHLVNASAMGDLDRAIADAQQLTQLFPDDPNGPLWLAYLALRAGDGETALEQLDDTIVRRPDFAWARGAAAYAELLVALREDVDGAGGLAGPNRRWLDEQAARLDSGDPGDGDTGVDAAVPAWLVVLGITGKDVTAARILDRLDQLEVLLLNASGDPDDARALRHVMAYNRGLVHHNGGDDALARDALADAAGAAGADEREARLLRALVLGAESDSLGAALAELRAIWTTWQDPTAIRGALWCLSQHRRRIPTWVGRAIKSRTSEHPELAAELLASLGALRFDLGDLAGAIASWDEAMALDARFAFLGPHVEALKSVLSP